MTDAGNALVIRLPAQRQRLNHLLVLNAGFVETRTGLDKSCFLIKPDGMDLGVEKHLIKTQRPCFLNSGTEDGGTNSLAAY